MATSLATSFADQRTHGLPARCALSLVFVAVALLIRWAIDPLVGSAIPFFTFTLSTIFAALTLGLLPGLVAMVVGFAIAVFVFVEPRFSFDIESSDLDLTVLAFGTIGVTSAILGHLVRKQRLRLIAAADAARRQARALVAAEETTAYALLESQTATWELAVDSGDIVWSSNAARIFGLNEGEDGPTLEQIDQLVHPGDRVSVKVAIEKAIAERRPYEANHRIVWPDGTVRQVLVKGRARYESGRPVRMSGVVLDVTHLRAAEAAQRETEERLIMAVESAALGTWDIDFGSGVVTWSPRCRELFGAGGQENVDLDGFFALIHEGDAAQVRGAIEAAKAGVRDGLLDVVFRTGRQADVECWRRVKGRAYVDGTGRTTRLTGTVIDVTGERMLTESLRRAKEASEAANEAKSAFLANMSHEIRTPLNAIMGFSELLLDPNLSSVERHDCVATITRNGQMLARLIDDILDLSKVEAGKLGLIRESVDLSALLSEVAQVLQDMARRNGVVLDVVCEPGVPPSVQSDPVRLRQVLINIVGNAVKFTQNGRVDVRVRVLSREADVFTLGFVVTDEGPGIEPNVHESLFRPFQQSDASTTRRFGGTGLGLALSRRLARALGGDVELVRSIPGEGSVFLVSVKAQAATVERPSDPPTKSPTSALTASLEGLKVLVAEDTPDSQYLIRRILQRAGALVDAAGDGAEAIEMVQGKDYDLVLMDIQMPEVDGYEATATLRRQGFAKPIIALTAHAMKEERERTRAVGFSDHVTKPINPAALLRTLARHADRDTI